jgi:hypothetical protein
MTQGRCRTTFSYASDMSTSDCWGRRLVDILRVRLLVTVVRHTAIVAR